MKIVYYSLFPWKQTYRSTSHFMAAELSESHEVIYLNPAISYWGWVKKLFSRLRGRAGNINADHDSLLTRDLPIILPINWLPPGLFYDFGHHLNTMLIRKAVNRFLKRYDFYDFVFINCFNPIYLNRFADFDRKPGLLVYQCVDDIHQIRYLRKHGIKKELEMVNQSQLVVTTSTALAEKMKELTSRVSLISNGVDYRLFSRAASEKWDCPRELKEFCGRRRIVGYIGSLDSQRIDFDLILSLAEELQEIMVLLIGPLRTSGTIRYKLQNTPNIFLTGPKEHGELLPYLNQMHCTIIPFERNEFNKSVYPLKLNEYLAAGKKVVSTNFSPEVISFGHIIDIAKTREEFIQMVARSVDKVQTLEEVKERMGIGQKNSWELKAAELVELLNHYLQNKHEN